MLSSCIDSLLRRTGLSRSVLIAVAFWALTALALLDPRELRLWGMPEVDLVVARATMACCLIVAILIGIRHPGSRRESVRSVSFWRQSVGTPDLLLFAAVASYLAMGAIVLIVEGNWQPDITGSLKHQGLLLGVFVTAALGGGAVLERTGAGRLLQGVLVVLIASCAVILASPLLREFGVLPPYRVPFRLTGAFADPNDAALVACMTVALALAFPTDGGPHRLGYGTGDGVPRQSWPRLPGRRSSCSSPYRFYSCCSICGTGGRPFFFACPGSEGGGWSAWPSLRSR